MNYAIKPTGRFKKDLKKIQKRGYDISLLTDIIKKLAKGETLPEHNRDHALIGNLYLYLTRTGTHSDIFDL